MLRTGSRSVALAAPAEAAPRGVVLGDERAELEQAEGAGVLRRRIEAALLHDQRDDEERGNAVVALGARDGFADRAAQLAAEVARLGPEHGLEGLRLGVGQVALGCAVRRVVRGELAVGSRARGGTDAKGAEGGEEQAGGVLRSP